MLTRAYTIGFQNAIDGFHSHPLKVEGVIPSWLQGKLIRNGPAKFNLGQEQVRHWFDGMALLQSFDFSEQKVLYSCRFLQSKAYTKSQTRQKISSYEFATKPNENFFERFKALICQPETDNANVNIIKINNRHLAITETPFAWEFNPNTLGTCGPFSFNDKLKGQITTAHPQFDTDTQETYNLLSCLSKTSKYQFYKIAKNSLTRELLCSIPVKEPSYIHSFALTSIYIVLFEFPLLLKPLELLLSGKPYIENYHWQAKRPSRITVINKKDGSITACLETDPCFAFHHINAFDTADTVIVDLVSYDNSSVIESFYLANLLNSEKQSSPIPASKIRRYEISLKNKSVRHHYISDCLVELPSISFAKHNGKDYRYIYAASASQEGSFLDSLVKVDISENSSSKQLWQRENIYAGEPIFVPAPNSKKEDHGIILSLCLNVKEQRSELYVLDAISMTEIARAELPALLPFGLHGQFYNQKRTN